MTKPITPDEVVALKRDQMPDQIIEVWNQVIALKYAGDSSRVLQDEIIVAICAATDFDRTEIFANKFLDVEDIYRDAGWIVTYNKPAYSDSYSAYFDFQKR